MTASLFEQLEATLKTEGAGPAIARLCQSLRNSKDYNALFYALLLAKRHELGVSPVPITGPGSDLPDTLLPAYNDAICEAAREVGNLHLAAGNLAQAWECFKLIGEPEVIRQALDQCEPGDDDLQRLIEIAFYEGVHPRKGFDWVLSRYGICSAITTVSGELPHADEDKLYFVRSLVRSLYHDLRERLANEIEHRFSVRPAEAELPQDTPGVVVKLIAEREWLFADEAYHIDTSHLSSVVQMSMHLKPCLELNLARELCQYGQRLTGRFMGEDSTPFENGYADYEIYLSILAGDRVEEGLQHFRAKVEKADPEEDGTYPAEVLVNLLLKVDRGREAVEVARKYLDQAGRRLTCPDVYELCERFKDYDSLADAAKKQGDVVNYLAGRIAAEKS